MLFRQSLAFLCIFTVFSIHAKTPVLDPTSTLHFVTLPAGSFTMGTPDLTAAIAEMPKPDKSQISDEQPAHLIHFSNAVLMATTEVTQKTWFDIMSSKPGPKQQWQQSNWEQLPVVSVNWFDTQQFIKKLNTRSNTYHYRLPTEAEWEYAARAGSSQLRPFSTLAMDDYAWYINSSNDEIHPVATKLANQWGLYDLYGNAWEWVSDWYSPKTYANTQTNNPTGASTGSKKVRRGGSFHCPPHLIRPAYRAADLPDKAYSVLGFRLIAEKK